MMYFFISKNIKQCKISIFWFNITPGLGKTLKPPYLENYWFFRHDRNIYFNPQKNTFLLSYTRAFNFDFHFRPLAKPMTSRGGHPNFQNHVHHSFSWSLRPKWPFKKVSLLLTSLCTRKLFLWHYSSHYSSVPFSSHTLW